MIIPENLFFASEKIKGIEFNIYSTAIGIRKINMNESGDIANTSKLTRLRTDDPYMFSVFDQLKEYFSWERTLFEVPVDLKGTEFQLKVWNLLLKIPYGKTQTYKYLAKRLGNEKLIRAVGRAVGSNPVPVIIPCHRVLGSDGKLTGYSGGVGIKEKLLELEGSKSLELFE
ncbi:MAG: methylated-DNA--[protein]-cysteine S-methyltransferase [Ignavibacteriaceae bacterium]